MTLRIADDRVGLIDDLAKAAGMKRSAWITRAINDALQSRPDEMRDVPSLAGQSDRVTIRLDRTEVAAIDAAAAATGATRMHWIKRTIRWQLWGRAGELRLAPFTARAITKLTFQTRAIGRLLNDSVRAIHSASLRESTPELISSTKHILAMEERISSQLEANANALQHLIAGEVSYWTRREDLGR